MRLKTKPTKREKLTQELEDLEEQAKAKRREWHDAPLLDDDWDDSEVHGGGNGYVKGVVL